MSETQDLTRPLIDALNQTGGLALRMNSGKVPVKGGYLQLHDAGTADILFFRRLAGITLWMRPVWIETKVPKGTTKNKTLEAQAAFKERVLALGHRYIRATTIDEGLEALK